MSLWSNVTDWAKDTASNVSSAVKNTTSNIGDWMEEKYNNAKTALTISTPTATPTPTYTSGGDTRTSDIYSSNNSSSTSNSTNNNTSSTSNKSSASSNSSSNSAALAAYEALLAKTTAIENIQKSLNTVKQTDYNGEELKVDGDFGIKTQYAWDSYLQAKGAPNYLAGIAGSTKTPSYYYNNQPIKTSTVKESQISEPSGNILYGEDIAEYLFNEQFPQFGNKQKSPYEEMQEIYYDMYGEEPPSLIDKEQLSSFVSNATEGIKDGIFSLASGIGNADLYESNGLLTQSDEILDAAKIGGNAISNIGLGVSAVEALYAAINNDMKSATKIVGSVAGSLPGVKIGALAGAGFGPVGVAIGGTIGGVAFGMLGSELSGIAYDELNE